jgi:hypothetical protein
MATDPYDVSQVVLPGPGAPKGSLGPIRHGLATEKLPPGCGGIRKVLAQFQQALEVAVLAVRECLSITDAALISSAVHWQRHSLLAMRWLRLEFASLSPQDRLHYSREIALASDKRDKCIKELRLDAAARTLTANYYDLAETLEIEEDSGDVGRQAAVSGVQFGVGGDGDGPGRSEGESSAAAETTQPEEAGATLAADHGAAGPDGGED